MNTPSVEVLTLEGCPNAEPTIALVAEVMRAFRLPDGLTLTRIDTAEQARACRFPGSPTVLAGGRDLEDAAVDGGGLTCRVYRDALAGASGVPPRWLIEAALLRAMAPRGYLFLCVANSARSQMAEGIAKLRLGPDCFIQSAGSAPTHIRPEAVRVLREIGVDASLQYAKAIDETDLSLVDVVITLCAEEACPVFPGDAIRVHWGLPDPAETGGDQETRLGAFRRTRDELDRRITTLMASSRG